AQTVLETQIEEEPGPQIKDSSLISGTLDRLELLRLLAFPVDLRQEGRDLVEAETSMATGKKPEDREHFLRGRRVVDADVILAFAQQGEELVIVDHESRVGVRFLGAEGDIQEAFGRRCNE